MEHFGLYITFTVQFTSVVALCRMETGYDRPE
jgi:hypothetical protein